MKLRSLLLALALTLTLSAASAHAQIGIYLNPIASRISNSRPDTGAFAFLGENSTSAWFGGVDFGGYYTIVQNPRFEAGLDLRDMVLVNTSNASLNSFLLGIRLAGHLEHSKLRPYVQPVVGVGSSKAPLNNLRVTKLQYGVFAGVDYPLSRHIDFRAAEIGYGSLQTQNTELYNGAFLYPNSTLLTVSTGFVFRF